MRLFAFSLACWVCGLHAADLWAQDAWVSICHGYGCAVESLVHYEADSLAALRGQLLAAPDAEAERALLAGAIGAMYRTAGEQSDVAADRGGNFADEEADGRMDCIDHSTSTTRLLRLLEARGALRFHKVLEPERRVRVLFQHYSAVVEEVPYQPPPPPAVVPDYLPVMLAQCDCAEALGDVPPPPAPVSVRPGARYVVDSWFVDNGEPAVVLPLADWLDGEGPNVQ